jgi:apolipoprotein D and lipocalin family protein
MPKEIKEQVVSHVDIPRFMGDWFVIASIPTPFEKGVYNGLETYRWNEEKKRVEITQKGWITDTTGNSHWLVQPFWPLKFDYLVIDLAEDYSWTIVGVPDKSYVWIMARKSSMGPEDYQLAISRLKKLGYRLDDLKKVPQNGDKP